MPADYVVAREPAPGEDMVNFLTGSGNWTTDLEAAEWMSPEKAHRVAGVGCRAFLGSVLRSRAVMQVPADALATADIAGYGERVCAALGWQMLSHRDAAIVAEWADAGIDAGLILDVIQEVLGRRKVPRYRGLAYFVPAVQDRLRALPDLSRCRS